MTIGISAKNWKAHSGSSAVLGFLDIVIPLPGGGSITIQGCRYMHSQAKGTSWVAMPEREYQKQDGSKGYGKIVWIEGRDVSQQFQKEADAAAAALHRGAGPAPQAQPAASSWGKW